MSVIRKFVPASAPGSSVPAQVVQSTQIHWVSVGRQAPEIFAAVPSVHMAWQGCQSLCVDGRSLLLDDEVFLVLNAGHVLSSDGRRDPEACLLSVYFTPQLLSAALQGADAADLKLLCTSAPGCSPELFEHLRAFDKSVASVMRYLAHYTASGVGEPLWYEEQVGFLLKRLLANEAGILRAIAGLTHAKAWKRRETFVRMARVADLIHSAYDRELTISELAQAAQWSPFHMMREFKAVHGVSPYEFLQRRRTQAAVYLLRSTGLSAAEVAERVGFRERSTLMRRLRRSRGLGTRALRLLAQEDAESPQPAPRGMSARASSV